MNVGSIFVALGFKVDDKNLKQFDGGIRGLSSNMLAAVGSITAGLYALDRFVESSTTAAAKIANIGEQTGLGTTELQKFAYAANNANSAFSFDSALSGLANLRKSIYDIQMGKGNNSAWNILGIDPTGKDIEQIINELAEKTNGMDRARATDLLNQTGLGGDYLKLLQEIYQNPNYVNQTGLPLAISPDDLATLAEADRLLNNMWKNLSLMKSQATVSLFKWAEGLGDPRYENNRVQEVKDWWEFVKEGAGNKVDGGVNWLKEMAQPEADIPFEDTLLYKGLKNSLSFLEEADRNVRTAQGDTNVTINVNGVQDPDAVGEAVQRHIQEAQDQRPARLP
ncbi:hypothetical protein [Dyadobacter psychrotolerans]|uniref:Uncharacterized protein n=1 Tax=Dyadobacter psychrotolerans TaxID=2541721 RepID=A0A4V2Z4R5_9BACT|nr:hypothetical protein [Dyadobacter psychrotolerans]TDE17718.1 hypothetical protein E0F88_07455 [Dyadobacter psychrotolerans]